MKKLHIILLVLLFTTAVFFRFYHIETGLPQTFYADEPEFGEFAINYTFQFSNILRNGDWYKLIPISYVYGTFPIYLLTLFLMVFSKLANLINMGFDKTTLYILMRSFFAFLTLAIIPTGYYFAKKLSPSFFVHIFVVFLLALNWKLIVHTHYLNADIIQVLLIAISFLTFYSYYKKEKASFALSLTAILLGAAIGTKITTLITIPLYLAVILSKKDLKGFLAFIFICIGTFIFTNPFSFVFFDDFFFRIFSMYTKEAGVVFDSVDMNPLKYIYALINICSPLVFFSALYGMFIYLKTKNDKLFHFFLMANVVVYLIFFSLQNRYVDRWLLPIILIVFFYSAVGIEKITNTLTMLARLTLIGIVVIGYIYYPLHLLRHYQRDTPRGLAYYWMKDNLDPLASKLVYSEEGLDPMNKIKNAKVLKIKVYPQENHYLFMPEDPQKYHYVVLSSRQMEIYQKPEIKKLYPHYISRWEEFYNTIDDTTKFRLVKEFTLPKPNIIPLSDIFIFRNLNPPPLMAAN